MRPRLFVAINPPERLRDSLVRCQQLLSGLEWKVKWVERDNLHLTLAFLGETDQERIPDINQILFRAAELSSVFSLRFEGLGAFPNLKRPRVIWAGLAGQVGQLNLLHRSIIEGLQGIGLKPDDKPFRPHLTLGRIRGPASEDAGKESLVLFKQAEQALPGESWKAFCIDLMQSELGHSGPRYTVLASFPIRDVNVQ